MQLVIEIHEPPKNDHERWVLAHGIPLPKNHGRLIDVDEAIEHIDWSPTVIPERRDAE